jgi:hypothetical protein
MRRSLFALLGLVLPVAFTAAPAAAATSNSVQHKTTHHATAATHKAKPQHSSHVQHASHHTTATHHASHKVAAS